MAHRAGRMAAAIRGYRRILADEPRRFEALYLLGLALAQSGEYSESLRFLEQARKARPNDPAVFNVRGNALAGLGRHSEALECYDRAVELDPHLAEAFYNRGIAFAASGRYEKALASYDRAIELNGCYAEAHNNRGNALSALRRNAEALESYENALRVRPAFVEAMVNRSIALRYLHRLEEAIDAAREVLRVNPNCAEGHGIHGVVLATLGRYSEARAAYNQSLELNPNLPDARWNKALLHLLLGEFLEAWSHYESRWEVASLGLQARYPQVPAWNGAPIIPGQKLFLHAEQGYGDTIQFSRYATLLRNRGARVVLEVPGSLVRLLQSLDGPEEVISQGSATPEFDLHCPLPSLPCAFATQLETIPSQRSYLRADPRDEASWRERLGIRRSPRIGLAWAGNPAHRNDAQRSIPLRDLLPMTACGLEFIGLHKVLAPEEQSLLAAVPRIRHFGPALVDFAQTAALIAQMDLVISVDTAVAHLAGALGTPTWILLPHVPDWRWLLGRDSSPWYPTARLWRQAHAGDWPSLVQQVGRELRTV